MSLDRTPSTVARIVFASALYDLVVTAPFATPWTATRVIGILGRIHGALGLSGPLPTLDGPLPILFANLMGSIVLVWAVLRLRTPTARFGAADTVGRILFSTWMAYALGHGGSVVLLAFLVVEVAWGIVQGVAVFPALRPQRLASISQ